MKNINNIYDIFKEKSFFLDKRFNLSQLIIFILIEILCHLNLKKEYRGKETRYFKIIPSLSKFDKIFTL